MVGVSKGKNAKYVPAKQSNTMTYVLGGIAVLVVIVVVIGGVLLISKKEGTPADQVASKLNDATPAFVLGKADAKTTLDFFEDPMCPACGSMEKAYGEQINKAVEDGKVKVRYHLVSFLNRFSASKDYSDRAGGALLAIASSSLPDDQKQKAWMGAHVAIFGNQPEENGATDHSNADLARIVAEGAKTKGVELPVDVTAGISEGKFATQGAAKAGDASNLMQAVGATGTPSVFHNGAKVEVQGDWLTPLLG